MSGSSWYSSAETHIWRPDNFVNEDTYLHGLGNYKPFWRYSDLLRLIHRSMSSIYALEVRRSWSSHLSEQAFWLRWVNDLQILETELKAKSLIPEFGVPLQRVLPPLSTMFEKRLLRRSKSTRLMESTTTWCTPAYSSPISSGLKRISGALNRSGPSYRPFPLWFPQM